MYSFETKMAEIANTVARRYRRRCWWAEEDDLTQQAWVGVLSAYHVVFDAVYASDREIAEPRRKAFGNIAYHAAWATTGRYLWRQSSPVTITDHAFKDVRALGELRSEELSDEMVCPSATPEALYAAAEAVWVEEHQVLPAIARRLTELYARTGWSEAYLRANMAIYLEGLSPRAAAARAEVDVRGVYKTTVSMRGMLRKDGKMRSIVDRLREGRA